MARVEIASLNQIAANERIYLRAIGSPLVLICSFSLLFLPSSAPRMTDHPSTPAAAHFPLSFRSFATVVSRSRVQ